MIVAGHDGAADHRRVERDPVPARPTRSLRPPRSDRRRVLPGDAGRRPAEFSARADYHRGMAPPTGPFRAEAVTDTVQLDGARHLTLEGESPDHRTALTLHLILDREGGVSEGDLSLDGPDGVWSAALEAVLDAVMDAGHVGLLHLRARFRDADLSTACLVTVREEEDATYSVQLTPDTDTDQPPPPPVAGRGARA